MPDSAESRSETDSLDRPVVALVMAGGTGTRLYPASRADRPKQFLSLGGEERGRDEGRGRSGDRGKGKGGDEGRGRDGDRGRGKGGSRGRGGDRGDSLLRQTVERVGFADEIYVSTAAEHSERVREEVPEAGVLVEPEAKDTGPALVYAAHRIREQIGECVLLCVPSDHLVAGDFESAAEIAVRAAVETGGLVTFAVEPTRPATGYGYVEPGDSGEEGGTASGYTEVEQFREKPDLETAREFVAQGFYWNAGLFAWTPEALLREARDSPLAPLITALDEGDPERGFREVESVSIDYAVLERTDDAYVVPADFEWDDVGSWDAIERVVETDEDGNAILGDALTIDAEDNVIAGGDDTHVSAVGVEGLVVAAYDDRVLVVPKDEAQRVREVVAELREQGRF